MGFVASGLVFGQMGGWIGVSLSRLRKSRANDQPSRTSSKELVALQLHRSSNGDLRERHTGSAWRVSTLSTRGRPGMALPPAVGDTRRDPGDSGSFMTTCSDVRA